MLIVFSDSKSDYLSLIKFQAIDRGLFITSDCSVTRLKERLRINGNWGNKFGAVVSN